MARAKNAEEGRGPGGRAEMGWSPADGTGGPGSLKPLLPLYAVVFAGFVGYSLMITVFTPMIMSNHDLLLRADEPMSRRVILLGLLLCLYPLGQFAGSPVLGALSDRFGRKPVLMISLCFTTGCYALIAIALELRSVALLASASLLAGLAEANVVAAQSAIADVITPQERNRFFGYIYLSASSAYIVGPLVGGKLADPDLVSWFSDATPFWAAMIVLAITTAATAFFFRETNPPGRRHSVSFRRPSPIFEASFPIAVCAGSIGSTSLSILRSLDFSAAIPCIWWTASISACRRFRSMWHGWAFRL